MRRIAVALLALTFAHAGRAQDFSDPRFATELVVTLPPFQPVGVTWAGDGRMFIWQKNGLVRVYHDEVLRQAPFLDLRGQVNTYDDRGLLGLALDPSFAQSGHVYLAYVHEAGGNPNDPSPKTSRITRVTADPANPDVALPGSEVVLIDGIPADSGSHNLGTLRFAGDGTLFVSSGDGAESAFADPRAFGAQDPASYRGKILRINPDGSAPAPPQLTNPFYDGTDSVVSRVWAYGLRNPYRFALHPVLGDLYAGEVGWNSWEEIDRILAGGNYGWPCFEGVEPQPQYQANFPVACSQVPAASVVPPLYTYDHSFGTAAVVGAFYTASAYPAEYRSNLFISDYSGGWIRRLALNPDGSIAQNLEFATNAGVIVSIELGPDGLLYLVDFLGEIRRVRYDGVVAAASGSPTSGHSPLDVAFSSAGSIDGLGGALTYLWDFGDGQTSTAADPLHTFVSGQVETFDTSLTVTNSASDTSTAFVQVTVGSLPPVPQIEAPSDGVGVHPGDVVSYSGSAIDPEEGALPEGALQWDVLLHHDEHIHAFVGGVGASGSFLAKYHGTGSYAYELRLTASDASGLQDTTSVTIPVLDDSTPPTVPANLAATGAGSHTVGLVWSASADGSGVSRYHVERCPGAACGTFVEIATPASSAYQDTTLVAGTTYTYRVRAEDLAGNLGGYSQRATASTASAPPPLPGLVAAYGFEEGIGGSAGDASGNGNEGAVGGASWGPGRFGTALGFDGVDDVVVVGDSSSLDLATGMTIEAWVHPTSLLSGWKAIAQKEVDAYFLDANTAGNRIGVGGTFAGSCCTVLEGPSALIPNRWTHVAGTYDGATLRLYVDGLEVASQARTGSLEVNGSPLRLGGNTYPGEFFPGWIDDLRIYDRALTPAEVQQDMDAPLGGGARFELRSRKRGR